LIYVTVGTQLPFDRLVRAVDEWAALRGRHDVFAQIGLSLYRPSAISWENFLTPDKGVELLNRAEIIVSHAGTGTIIGALERCKPIIVVPRRADLGEHRTDHQMATARRFGERGLVSVAETGSALSQLLDRPELVSCVPRIDACADEHLIAFISSVLNGGGGGDYNRDFT